MHMRVGIAQQFIIQLLGFECNANGLGNLTHLLQKIHSKFRIKLVQICFVLLAKKQSIAFEILKIRNHDITRLKLSDKIRIRAIQYL